MAKNKKELPPEYYLSATNEPTLNYCIYYMKPFEKTICFLIAFIIGAAIAYVFYGGIGKDIDGNPTTLTYVLNISICGLVGIFAGKLFLPIRVEMIIQKRKKMLRIQFVDLLESLRTSLASGKNVPNAFLSAEVDLLLQYSEDSYIIKEIKLVNTSVANGIPIEELLMDFGMRSDIGDISNFGKVFEIAYRKGGNISDIVRNCHEIISEKIAIEMEIETKVTSNKNEQNLMCIMPIIMVLMMKSVGEDFSRNFVTPTGLISTSIAVIIFIASYFLGRKILKIEV